MSWQPGEEKQRSTSDSEAHGPLRDWLLPGRAIPARREVSPRFLRLRIRILELVRRLLRL